MELTSFQVVIAVFGTLLLVLFLIFKLLEKNRMRAAGHQKEGNRMYACGEDLKPEELNIPAESFYKVFIRILGLGAVRKAHSGRLGDYLLWVAVGAVLVIIYVMLVW
jgi:hypothetical protein